MFYFQSSLLCMAVVLTTALSAFKPIMVMIDPGHGGKYYGCWGKNKQCKEKELTLKLSLELAKLLQQKNILVDLTRTQDEALGPTLEEDLAARATLVRTMKPDLFISLHFNFTNDPKKRGLELYVPYDTKASLRKASYQLAASIHYQLIHRMEQNWIGNLLNVNGYDGGIRAAKFIVLRDLPCPAALLEVDYISNQAVEQEMLKPAFLKKVAAAISDGITDFVREGFRSAY